MTTVLFTVLGGVGLALVLATVLVARRTVRRVRVRMESVRERVAAVQTRAQPPGPRRDAQILRLRLQAEMRSTADLLETAPDGLIFRADALGVLQELTGAAAAVDAELAAVAGFLDTEQQRAALAPLVEQAEALIATTYEARRTMLRTAAEDRGHRIAELQADVARQSAALEVYRREDPELRL